MKKITNRTPAKQSQAYDQTHKLEEIGLFIGVVNKGLNTTLSDILTNENVAFEFTSHGKGTANKELYEIMGMSDNEKQIIFSLIPYKVWNSVKSRLKEMFTISNFTKGLGIIVKIDSICGVSLYRMVTNKKEENAKEDKVMEIENTINNGYEAIMAIVNDGYSSLVMDAAKKAGAKGGTILTAKGTGNKDMEKFFGIVISPGKEIVLIVVPKDIKDSVLSSISNECGINTKGQGIAFSFKADDVVGIVETEMVK